MLYPGSLNSPASRIQYPASRMREVILEKTEQRDRKRVKFIKRPCRVCKFNKEIDYKDIEFLKSFLNRRGRLISRTYTGNCAKHQRLVVKAIKRARNLAFLPFVS